MKNPKAYPLPDCTFRQSKELTRWIDGKHKPTIDWLYLRDFCEGVAVTEFRDGSWRRDGFFDSDVQDARWKGLKEPQG